MNSSFSRAENRVREMNNITRSYLEKSNRSFNKPSAVVSVPRFEPVQICETEPEICPEHQSPPKQCHTSSQKCTPSNPLDGLFNGKDGEKKLILILILVLINEKADIKLIIALLYLIL